MIDVKCFTFNYKAIVPKNLISDYVFDEQILKLTIDGQDVLPFLKLTSTSKDFSEYDSLSLVHGNIIELFHAAECDIEEIEQDLVINAIFKIEFSLGAPVVLKDDEIIYSQDGGDYPEDSGDYSYKVDGSFTDANSPSLTDSVEINSVITLETKFGIEDMTRALF